MESAVGARAGLWTLVIAAEEFIPIGHRASRRFRFEYTTGDGAGCAICCQGTEPC